MLEERTGFVLAKTNRNKHLGKTKSKNLETKSVVRSTLGRNQLGWEPDVALGGVWALSCSSGLQRILADSYLPTSLHFPISNSYFLLEFSRDAHTVAVNSSFSQKLSLKFLKRSNSYHLLRTAEAQLRGFRGNCCSQVPTSFRVKTQDTRP